MNIDTTPCPICKTVGGLSIEERLIADRFGSHSLSGTQLKVNARRRPVLVCARCAWLTVGEYDEDGQHATFPPSRSGP